jgi:hypothetical protein
MVRRQFGILDRVINILLHAKFSLHKKYFSQHLLENLTDAGLKALVMFDF